MKKATLGVDATKRSNLGKDGTRIRRILNGRTQMFSGQAKNIRGLLSISLSDEGTTSWGKPQKNHQGED